MNRFLKFFWGVKIAAKPVIKPVLVKPAVKVATVKRIIVKKVVKPVAKQIVKPVLVPAPKVIKHWLPKAKPVPVPAPKVIKVAPVPQKPVVEKVVVAAKAPETVLTPYVYPYDMDSEAATLIAAEIKAKRVYPDGAYVHQKGHLIINYGNRRQPNWATKDINILNHWNAIEVSSNKLTALTAFKDKGVQTVEFTTDRKVAAGWIKKGGVVMCRKILNGYSGHGIVVASEEKQLVDAPLYCLYKKHMNEFRVIVVNGVVVDFMQKKRKSDWEGENGEKVNPLIKNHCNGWIFARQEVNPPQCVLAEATKATAALGLNFGGVDVIYNQKENSAYVLECNTAIGLQSKGTTLKRLTDAFNAIINNKAPKSVV